MIKKLITTALIGTTIASANYLYTDTYLSSSGVVYPYIDTGIPNRVSVDKLMKRRTVFSASLYFEGGTLTEASQKALKKIVEIIQENGSKPYYISIIGHTASFTTPSHDIKLNFWSSLWHDIGNHRVSRDSISDRVNRRIVSVYNLLKENHIDTDRIYTENRMDRDPTSTEAISEGREINQRVEVALYY